MFRPYYSSPNMSPILRPLILVLSFFMTIAIFTASVSFKNCMKEHGKNNTGSMFLVGSIDGKSFYVEYEPFKNWTEAKQFCINSGMRLASITTLEQANFLQSRRNCTNGPIDFCGGYWIAGRITKADINISDFAWDHNNETVKNPGIRYIKSGTLNQCLYYGTGNGGLIRPLDCSLRFGTLCEGLQKA